MTILHIDFETYSAVDLKSCGVDVYTRDPSTGVHCAAYAFDQEPVQIWVAGEPCPDRVRQHIESGGLIYSHNAPFEIALANEVLVKKHGWPELKIEQMRCSMVMGYAMALPGRLEDMAPALGIAQRKDAAGKRVMLKLSQPKKDGSFWKPEDDPALFQQLYDYCKQDVEVERAIHARLMELSDAEQKVWQLDYAINQRGIQVDLASIDKAIALAAGEKKRLDAEMLRVTGGCVGSCSEVQLLVKWIASHGVEMKGVAKAEVLDALEGDLPLPVRQALELRKEAGKSSVAKLVAMRDRACPDGRIRAIHQFHGAATGRWAGRGVQTQNLPRWRPGTKAADVQDIIEHLDDRDYLDMFHGPVLDALADSLRSMIIAAPGHDLIAVDFSNVEGRVLAWLAQEDWKIRAFQAFDRGEGPDIYKLTYSRAFGVPVDQVTKEQRQIGKVMELALGYGGGVGAFQSMAKNYGVKVADAEADRLKDAWRAAHPKICEYWLQLERTALHAMESGRQMPTQFRYNPPIFKQAGSFLWVKLPSHRVLCYPYPEIQAIETPWGQMRDTLTYMTMVSNLKAKTVGDDRQFGTWKRVATYGGSLTENVTQAVARDLLAQAMLRLEAAGYKVVMHVHDEAVVEVTTSCHPDTLKKVEALMVELPDWAFGLPIAAEGWRGPRYRK
jgi:DNA polymerase bacteriophage-type